MTLLKDALRVMPLLEKIDAQPPSYTLSRAAALQRVTIVMLTTGVSLLLIHYLKYHSSFLAFLSFSASFYDQTALQVKHTLNQTGFYSLIGYAWWTFWHLMGYILLPFIVIRFLLKEKIADFGWRWNETHKHWAGYVLLITPILFFIFLVSFREDFLQHYPFYNNAGRSWFDLIAWEVLYLLQFAALEFFFRGFMVQSLRPAMGANAIWVMTLPYLMIHFPKLWPEAFGALLFGLYLGILALKSRSIWGGFFVHAGIAITMDVTSLVKQDNLPTQWWPF